MNNFEFSRWFERIQKSEMSTKTCLMFYIANFTITIVPGID